MSIVQVPSASSGKCRYDEVGGMMCCACSDETLIEHAKQTPVVAAFVATLARRCVCCNVLTTTDKHTYLYPFGLVLCRRHSVRNMVNYVETSVAPVATSREQASKLIIAHFTRRRESKRVSQRASDNRQMKHRRQRNRQHKC